MSYQEQGGGGNESVVVNGTVEGVEIKPNGRYVVKVRELGSTSQYALNLNTKEQGLAQQMMNSIGQQFSFICGLSHWTNQTGAPVTSKWINGVAPLQGGMQQPQQMQQAQPMQAQPQMQAQQAQPQGWSGAQPQMQPQAQPMQQPMQQQAPPQQQEVTDDAFIRRVSWLAAVPAAVAALNHLPEDQRTVAALVKMTDFLARTAILRGQQGFGQDGNPGGGSEYHPGYAAVPGMVAADPGPEQGYTAPDDIPF
jgi:hypothetical protein